MQLSLKGKALTHFFVRFLETILNFGHFEKKMIVIATLFWKVQTVKVWKVQTLKDLVRPISKKHRFRTSFDSQHVKGPQTLVNPA